MPTPLRSLLQKMGQKRAFALHFEVWADPLRHVLVTDTACVVTTSYTNIADLLDELGAWDALESPPNAIAVFADKGPTGLRWEPIEL